MSITIKLDDLVQSNGALLELGEVATFPPAAAFKIARVIRKSRDEIRGWTEQRGRIFRDLPADGGKVHAAIRPHPQQPGDVWLDMSKLTLEESDAIAAKMKALGEAEVTIDAGAIALAELGANPAVKPNVLATLDWLVKERL